MKHLKNKKTKLIPLTQGKFSIVDAEDYDFLMQWKWNYNKATGYPRCRRKSETFYIHRLIMNTPEGMHTDHINGDSLDNRRCNLRICTPSQNQCNQHAVRGKTSQYKGVCWNRKTKKWTANIKYKGVAKHLGSFATEREAALAYDAGAKKLHGEFATTNF